VKARRVAAALKDVASYLIVVVVIVYIFLLVYVTSLEELFISIPPKEKINKVE
jgi:hypothetical protein